jgi:putative DNA primase/helicase
MTLHGYEGSPVLRQFEAAMARRGLLPPQRLIADGNIHRCNTKAKNGRGDGSYLLHLGGTVPAGGFQNFQDGLGWENWSFNPGRELTTAERAEIKQKAEATAKARTESKAQDQAKAAVKARRLWDSAADLSQAHGYLQRKNIEPHAARLKYSSALIPLFDEAGALVNLQFIRSDGLKTFLKGGRVKGCSYRIDGDGSRIVIAEGFATAASIHEATGATVIVAFDGGNLLPVAGAVRKQSPDADIIIAADDDWKRKGNPGITKATEVARAIGAKLAVPQFGINRRDKDTDFNDLATFIGLEAVKRDIDAAVAPEPAPEQIDLKAEIARLAKLGKAEYDRERVPAAKRLGIRLGTLDEEVAKQRSAASSENDDPAHWRVEPWDKPVDGAALLDEIAAIFGRYLVLPRHIATVLALWTMHTWCIDATDISPYLIVKSPEKRCGKTTLLIILLFLTRRSELASNISPAAIFRYIERKNPALLIDEADTFVKGNDELRGILNSGHTRAAAYVIRTVEIGGDHVAKRFSTWAPKAIATIGDLADTLADRAITIVMQRRNRDQKIERLRRRDNTEFTKLRRMALRFAQDNMEALLEADADDRTQVPAELNDRAADNWRPLFAIADRAGGDWPQLAREAALALSGGASGDTDTMRVKLLRDIRSVCIDASGYPMDRVRTTELISRLTADPEMPWAEYHKGKPINANQLAKLLGQFGLVSGNLRFDVGTQAKGYNLQLFGETWEKYLDDGKTSSGSDFPSQSRPAVPDPTATGISATFDSRPGDALGRRAKVQEVQHPSHLGRRDGSETENWPREGKKANGGADAEPVATTAGVPGRENPKAQDGLPRFRKVGDGSVPPGTPCVRCYSADGHVWRLKDINVAGCKSEPLHFECAEAWFDYHPPPASNRPTAPPTVCARCGRSDGRLESHQIKVNGVEREAFLHLECWHAWRTHGATKVASEWRRTI